MAHSSTQPIRAAEVCNGLLTLTYHALYACTCHTALTLAVGHQSSARQVGNLDNYDPLNGEWGTIGGGGNNAVPAAARPAAAAAPASKCPFLPHTFKTCQLRTCPYTHVVTC
jgi:hypothetical protein